MTFRPKIRNAALVGAFAALTASAWATNEAMSNSTYVPAPSSAVEVPVPVVTVNDSLTANESVVQPNDVQYVSAPAATQPAITVEQRRLSEDERIQATVMDKLANNSRLSGKIGVTSKDSVVTLSGYTRTAGQAWHAERDARSVVGVKYVQNEIRPRVGGSV